MFIKKFLKETISWAFSVAIPLVVVTLLNVFVFQVTTVSGESMMQTLHNEDIYIISKTGNILQSYPNYGEIVVIDSRVSEKRTFLTEITEIYRYNAVRTLITGNQSKNYWIKRVIGLPGDRLYLTDGVVYRNGELLDEPYVNSAEKPFYYNNEFTVPEGHVFVMGDNRNHSSDSRDIGAIPIENVIGIAEFKIKSGE